MTQFADKSNKIRIRTIIAIVVLSYIVIAIKLIEVGSGGISSIRGMIKAYSNQHRRGEILDRNGVILATNVVTASVYAHPRQMLQHVEAADKIASILQNIEPKELAKKFLSGKQFIWIKRHITPEEHQKINDLGIPGVYFWDDEKRFYPQENLCAHVLGYVDIDGHGIAGIEKEYDKTLTKENIQLAIDIRAQYALYEALLNAIKTHDAIGGTGLVMDIENGEVLGLVSLPDFNPNHSAKISGGHIFNQATSGVYEMGSILKALTFSMAFEEEVIKMNDAFNVSQPLKIGRYLIHDFRGKGGMLSVPEILMYSSNIGVGQIAQRIGAVKKREYLDKLGMLSSVDFDLPESARPLYPHEQRWGDVYTITISYGHGIAITALHAAQAMSAILKDGYIVQPRLLLNDNVNQEQVDVQNKERVFSERTVQIMRKLLRLTVLKGSAKKANAKGYVVVGKTGTAEKNYGGRYQKDKNIAIFTGAFPGNNPKYLLFLAVDSPKPNKINMGFTTGGQVAAPAAKDVINKIAPMLGVLPQDEDNPALIQSMELNYTPRYNPDR